MEIGKSRALQAEWLLPRWVSEQRNWNRQELTGRLALIGAGDRTLINAVETYVSRPPDWPWFSGLDGRVTISNTRDFLRFMATGQPNSSGQIIFDPSVTRARINFQGNWYDLSEDNPDNGPDPWWENR